MISKNMIKDTKKPEKDFKWKKIQHNSESLDCPHCKYTEREKSLQDYIKDGSSTDRKKVKNSAGNIINGTRVEMTVIRGRYDDVIGWAESWQ